MSVPLSTFQRGSIYLDTMILYTLVRAEKRIQPIIQAFFQGIEKGHTQAYTSVLTFDELAYRLTLAEIRDNYPGSPLDHLRQREEEITKIVYPVILPTLRQLRHFPNLTVLEHRSDSLDAMIEVMEQYHLRPRDALHVAAMQSIACQDLASNDPHFDPIPHITRYAIES